MKKCPHPSWPFSVAAFVCRVAEIFWPNRPGVRRRFRPAVEGLEDRNLLAGPPVAMADAYMVLHDHSLITPAPGVLVNDMNTMGASVVQVSGPAHGTLSLNTSTGAFTYTPATHFMGQDSFSYNDAGPGGTSNTVTDTINVSDRAPMPMNDSYTVQQGQTLNATSVLANDSDPDGDPLKITSFTNPSHGTLTFNQQTGTFVYTPAAGFSGQDNFAYTVSDGILSASATVTINVMSSSLLPIMVPNQQEGAQLESPTSWNLLANAVDPNPGGTLDFSTISIVTPPNNAQLVVDPNTGIFYFTPNWLLPPVQPPNPVSPTTFQFTIRDNLGAVSNVATITINAWVAPTKNGFIVAADATRVTHSLQPVTIDVVSTVIINDGSQVDPTSVAFGPIAPQQGSASIDPVTGLITYTPGFGFIGFDFFTYTIKDTIGHMSGANVFVSTIPAASPRLQPDALGGQMLVVDGTPNNDTILVTPGPHKGDVLVSVNGINTGPFHPTSRLVVFGYGGDDRIQVSNRVKVPAWLVGGPGNDTLIAGGGPSVLLGGSGNDILVAGRGRDDEEMAGRGRDLLIGGTGSDTLIGNRNDILVAGTTSFDTDQASLNALLLEWNSWRSFKERVENLTGQVNKTSAKRLNGNVFLTLSTVQDDGAQDLVYGRRGKDLIFVTLGGPTGDLLIDREARDVVFALLGQAAQTGA